MSKFIAWVLIFSMIGCQGDSEREVLVEKMIGERVQAKLDIYIQAELGRCWKDLYDQASRTADSLLRLDPIQISLDSLKRPPVPVKPNLPAFERKVDSIKIVPLFPAKKDTLRKIELQ